MSDTRHRWLCLILGFAAIAAFVVLLHLGSVFLGWEMIEENRQRDLDVYAYVYSDVGELEDFLDNEAGKYGRAALIEALNRKDTCRP